MKCHVLKKKKKKKCPMKIGKNTDGENCLPVCSEGIRNFTLPARGDSMAAREGE